MKIGYLGPRGTFSEQAARHYAGKEEGVPYQTIVDVLQAVAQGHVPFGVVPIENSIEGTVNATVDTLIFDTNLSIQSQLILPIQQNLMVRKDQVHHKIEKILSHPQGLGQCRGYLNQKMNGIEIQETTSTAEASRIVSMTSKPFAAIGPEICKEVYDLEIIEENIQDNHQNKTSFVLVSKEAGAPPQKGRKTSIAFSAENKPGSLYRVLEIFGLWDINMTKITSRPTKEREGEYVFFVDIEGFEDEKDACDALTMVKRKTSFFKIFGSYEVIRM